MKVVYKVTFPTGKIYVGMDLPDTITYFGRFDRDLVAADFTPEQRRGFSLRKEILRESETATNAEVRTKELELIRQHRANDPAIGYNRWPRGTTPSWSPPDARFGWVKQSDLP